MTDDAVISAGSASRTLSEVRERAARLATGLAGAGIGEGDRVAIVMRNDIAFLEVTLAAGVLGAVPVPLNWHWHGDDLAHGLHNSRSVLAVAHTEFVVSVAAQAPHLPVLEVEEPLQLRTAYGLPASAPTGDWPILSEWISKHEPWSAPAPTAPMSVIYTSGTTGLAKGVLREPVAVEDRPNLARGVGELFHLAPGETTLVPAPLYHSAPNAHATFAAALGMNLHIMPRFDPEAFLDAVEERQVNSVQMVPTMFVRLLQLPEEVRRRYDLSSLRAVVHAAAPCPQHVKRAMIDWLGPIVYEYYGGAEIGVWTACDSAEALARPGTVGRRAFDVEVKILDEVGNEKDTGEDGIIYGSTFTGWPDFTYIDDDDKRRGMEIDGFLTLGDVGHLDSEGYLYLSDRLNDMVISGGVNIYPAEVEACLLRLDGIADAAVFGVPHPDLGEVLVGYVQTVPGASLDAQEVVAHVRAHLAGYKAPREVVFVDELPREDTGKLFKRRLKEQHAGRSTPRDETGVR